MKKKIITIFTLIISIFCLTMFSSCGTDKLYVAISPDYAPYEFIDKTKKDQEQYAGSDVELAKKIAADLGKELYIDAMGFSETLAAVQNGKVDLAISGFTYKEERAQNYELSKSYYDDGEGGQVLITLKANFEQFKNFELLNNSNVKVGAQAASTQYDYVVSQLPNAKIEQISSLSDGILWLKNGKVDALAVAQNYAEEVIKTDSSIVMCEEAFDVPNSGLFVLAKKGNTELIELVNKSIDDVVANGLYQKWIDESKELFEALGDNAAEEDRTEVVSDNFFVRIGQMFINNFGEFAKGLGITLALSICGVLFAIIFGVLLCVMNISKFKVLRVISSAYIEVIRAIPLLLQLTVIFLVMPKGMPKFITCVIALIINSSAYQAEIFRSGIQSVDKGQMEAARSLGLSYKMSMFKVILPQAIKNVLPSLANEFVALIKETSLASTFYVGDLMTVKTIITATTYDALTPYIIIAIIYFIITFSLSKLIKYAEKKVA